MLGELAEVDRESLENDPFHDVIFPRRRARVTGATSRARRRELSRSAHARRRALWQRRSDGEA